MQSYAFRLYPASFTFCFLTTVHPNSAYFQAYGVYFQTYGVSPIVKQCNFVLSPLLSYNIYARAYMRPLPHTTERQRQCALYCQKWTLFLPSISSKRCKICTRQALIVQKQSNIPHKRLLNVQDKRTFALANQPKRLRRADDYHAVRKRFRHLERFFAACFNSNHGFHGKKIQHDGPMFCTIHFT